jgi:hypothetical protein
MTASDPRPASALDVGLDPAAYALRPVRIVGDEFRVYEAVTFQDNPWQGCELYLRRCKSMGMIGGDYATIDVLNEAGDIIQDYQVCRAGFRYLRGQLKFKVVRDDGK